MTEQNQKRLSDATRRYRENFVWWAYWDATRNQTADYRNALIGSAMAMCGSPVHQFDGSRWDNDGLAKTFLSAFLGVNQEVRP